MAINRFPCHVYAVLLGTHCSTRLSTRFLGHDEIWGAVKDAIKEKNNNEFADIDADTLNLSKVTIPLEATNPLNPIGSSNAHCMPLLSFS